MFSGLRTRLPGELYHTTTSGLSKMVVSGSFVPRGLWRFEPKLKKHYIPVYSPNARTFGMLYCRQLPYKNNILIKVNNFRSNNGAIIRRKNHSVYGCITYYTVISTRYMIHIIHINYHIVSTLNCYCINININRIRFIKYNVGRII